MTSSIEPNFWLYIISTGLLLAAAAFVSGSEAALTIASTGKLRQRAEKGSRGASVALSVMEDPERIIGALRLANVLATIAVAAIVTLLWARTSGGPLAILGSVTFSTVVVVTFAELLPRAFVFTRPEAAASFVSRPIRILTLSLAPVVALMRATVRVLLRMAGIRTTAEDHILSVHDEIADALAAGQSSGTVEKDHRDRLLGALDLSERTVEEVMRHRSQIEMIDAEAAPNDIIADVLASPHTRLPLFRGSRENIVGVMHAKDLLRAVDRFLRDGDGTLASVSGLDVMAVAMKPYFVPDTTPLDEQMRAFLQRRTHFALVVDEYGDLKGLITLEDIIEEITGEITDEFDVKGNQTLRASDDGAFVVDGAMTIRDFNRATDCDLPDDEANTLAGLVIHEAQTIPNEGQVFSFHGFRFEVTTRKQNRITRLTVRSLRDVSA